MKFKVLLKVFVVLSLVALSRGDDEPKEQIYKIKSSWNNKSTVPEDEYIQIRFYAPESTPNGVRGVGLDIKAPFYDDPAPPGRPGRFDGLWDYEVVEVFLLGNDKKYIELEFGPHGHYLVYQLEGVRNPVNTTQGLEIYSVSRNTTAKVWHGTAFIAEDQLPEGLNSFNAYAIHGEGDARVYMALYPNEDENAAGPDFHMLETFQPIDLSKLISGGAFGSITN
jgi:hypothetical protein